MKQYQNGIKNRTRIMVELTINPHLSHRELCKKIGLSSNGSLSRHIATLRDSGFITFEKGKARTIQVVIPVYQTGSIAYWSYDNESART